MNCRVMEVSIFTRPDMNRLLDRFVEMRLHVDDKDEELAESFQRYQRRLVNNPALPSYAIIEAGKPDRALATYLGADLSGSSFKKFLEDYLARR